MAVMLDTKSAGEMRAEKRHNVAKKLFKAFYILCAAGAAAVIAWSVYYCIAKTDNMEVTGEKITSLSMNYDALKQEVADYNAKLELEKEENKDDTEENIIKKEMYSAQEAAEQVLFLHDKLYKDQLVLSEDKTLLKQLTHENTLWFGSRLNHRKANKFVLECLTWYDSQNRNYDVVWGVYTEDYKYPLRFIFTTYDGTTNSFRRTGDYTTYYGGYFAKYGNLNGANALNYTADLEDDEITAPMDPVVDDVNDMLGDLISGETDTLTNPTETPEETTDTTTSATNTITMPEWVQAQ